jgi:hypothetical protein
MQKTINLDREFIRWFYEEPYPLVGCNRAWVFNANANPNVNDRDYWMRIAFMQGAQTMVNYITTPENDATCVELNDIFGSKQLELF